MATRVHDPMMALCYTIIATTSIAMVYVEIPVTVQLLLLVLPTLYLGCHYSLLIADEDVEHMESKDAMMFPVFGSAMLLTLYGILKYLPKEYVTLAIKLYFSVMGTMAMAQTFSQTMRQFCISDRTLFTFPLHQRIRGLLDIGDNPLEVTITGVVGFLLALPVTAAYLFTNHFICNNVIGISFSLQAIRLVNVSTFMNGAVMLSGLFVYDIFWVFATDVMVHVATSFDGPIKLLFPRELGLLKPSLLGLGDIVVPGVFISLMLRFDRSLSKASEDRGTVPKRRVYFWTVMYSYIVGMLVTLYVMTAFEAAQPALLYLVPCCLLSVISVSLVRGEFKALFYYSEDKSVKEKKE